MFSESKCSSLNAVMIIKVCSEARDIEIGVLDHFLLPPLMLSFCIFLFKKSGDRDQVTIHSSLWALWALAAGQKVPIYFDTSPLNPTSQCWSVARLY